MVLNYPYPEIRKVGIDSYKEGKVDNKKGKDANSIFIYKTNDWLVQYLHPNFSHLFGFVA